MPNTLAQYGPREPLAHKTTHQDGGTDELDLTGLVGKSLYTSRGDPAAQDFTGLTLNAAWHDLDLFSIVPAGAKQVRIRIEAINCAAVANAIHFRKKGNTNVIALLTCRGFAVGAANEVNGDLDCSTARVIEYLASTAGFANVAVTVLGWWL